MMGVGFLLLKLFGDSSGAFLIVMLIAFGTVYGELKFGERYVMYMVKVGHISVVVELLKNGQIPDGKGQIAYGKKQVKKHFGSANLASFCRQYSRSCCCLTNTTLNVENG